MAGGWDDDDADAGGGIDLSRGGAMGAHAAGPSSYSGGGLALGEDDPFADDAPLGSLELDMPAAPPARAHPSGGYPAVQSGLPSVPPGGDEGHRPASKIPAPRSEGPPPSAGETDRHAPPPVAPAAVARVFPSVDTSAAMIARFPSPPARAWQAPSYAVRVAWRQFELRQDLASLRKRRSPDVSLYERALVTHDAKSFALGIAITITLFVVATFIFFLPVILRFARAPD